MGQVVKNIAVVIMAVSLIFLLSLVINDNGQTQQLTGAFSIIDVAPEDFVYVQPADLSQAAADKAIEQAEDDVFEMDAYNFVNVYASDALTEAKVAYEAGDYEQVFRLTQLIAHIKKEKIEFYDRLKLLEVKKQTLADKGVEDIYEINNLSQTAMNYFNLEQIDNAKDALFEANKMADQLNQEYLRVKFVSTLTQNVLVRYWWQIIIVILLLAFLTPRVYRRTRIHLLSKKINHLKIERKKTKNLIKDLQKECFIKKEITTQTYKERAAKYEDRITEIKQILPVLESHLKNVGKTSIKDLFKRRSKSK